MLQDGNETASARTVSAADRFVGSLKDLRKALDRAQRVLDRVRDGEIPVAGIERNDQVEPVTPLAMVLNSGPDTIMENARELNVILDMFEEILL